MKYNITKKLGSGGNATVYEIQTNDNKIIALKNFIRMQIEKRNLVLEMKLMLLDKIAKKLLV